MSAAVVVEDNVVCVVGRGCCVAAEKESEKLSMKRSYNYQKLT